MIIVLGKGIDKGDLPNTDVLDYIITDNAMKANMLASKENCTSIYVDNTFNENTINFKPEVKLKMTFYSTLTDLIEKIEGIKHTEVHVIKEEEQNSTSEVQSVPRHIDLSFDKTKEVIHHKQGSTIPDTPSEPILSFESVSEKIEPVKNDTFIEEQPISAIIQPIAIPSQEEKPLEYNPQNNVILAKANETIPSELETPSVQLSNPIIGVLPQEEKAIEDTTPVATVMEYENKDERGTNTVSDNNVIQNIPSVAEAPPTLAVSSSTPKVQPTLQIELPTVVEVPTFDMDKILKGVSAEQFLEPKTRSGIFTYEELQAKPLLVTNTFLPILMSKGREKITSLENKIVAKQQELVSVEQQIKDKLSELNKAFEEKFNELQQETASKIVQANNTITSIHEEKVRLLEEINKNPLVIYGKTPRAVTVTRHKYTTNGNVSFVVKGAGVSAKSFYGQVQNLITSKPAVYLDLTCNSLLTIMNSIGTPSTSSMLAETLKPAGNQVASSVLYPSETIQDIALFEYPLKEVLEVLQKTYPKNKIIILLDSVEQTSVKTVVNDLSKSGVNGGIVVDERVNVFLTYNELPFIDLQNIALYVFDATTELKRMVSNTSDIIQAYVFDTSIDWTNTALLLGR